MQPPRIQKNPDHKTPPSKRKLAYLMRIWRDRPESDRAAPVLARFPATAGSSDRPAVRIFIGTESGQARAERVLVWSVLKHRDPARDYEIYLMKRLKGFERRYWKTGFTNYRYAIPHLAGREGRAIYNDADQIYLADPAEMFDLAMAEAAAMDVDGRDTSVMLLDCARMADVWPEDLSRSEKAKHQEFRDLRDAHDLWGPLPEGWNARDDEYRAGDSKLLHFTTLQTQPWRPFPEELRYDAHPDGDVWHDLEREADRAGFTIFTRARPSPEFRATVAAAPDRQPADADLRRAARLARAAGAERLLCVELGAAAEAGARALAADGLAADAFDALAESAAPAGTHDAAVSVAGIDRAPEEDVAWLLDCLFKAAGRFVYVSVACRLLSPEWWRGQMEAAARRSPGRTWMLRTERDVGVARVKTFRG